MHVNEKWRVHTPEHLPREPYMQGDLLVVKDPTGSWFWHRMTDRAGRPPDFPGPGWTRLPLATDEEMGGMVLFAKQYDWEAARHALPDEGQP